MLRAIKDKENEIMLRNQARGFMKCEDFNSVEQFKNALSSFCCNSHLCSTTDEHQRRQQLAFEIIGFLKNADAISTSDKLIFLEVAICHPAFSSRNLGAIKRGLNSLFSGKGPIENTNPYFQSSSQSLLIQYRDTLFLQVQEENAMIYNSQRYF